MTLPHGKHWCDESLASTCRVEGVDAGVVVVAHVGRGVLEGLPAVAACELPVPLGAGAVSHLDILQPCCLSAWSMCGESWLDGYLAELKKNIKKWTHFCPSGSNWNDNEAFCHN